MSECRRVLKPEGVLRLALPNLRSLVDRYLASDEQEAADKFMDASLLGLPDRPKGLRRLVDQLSGARHRWMYDAASLQALCVRRGFVVQGNGPFAREGARDLSK